MMELKELKERLRGIKSHNIRVTAHASKRIQDKRRKINYPQIISLVISQKGLYKIQEQPAKNKNELKFKLWFKLNYLYDMNIYIIINKTPLEKDLNRLVIISAHKVKRKIQEKIEHENKY